MCFFSNYIFIYYIKYILLLLFLYILFFWTAHSIVEWNSLLFDAKFSRYALYASKLFNDVIDRVAGDLDDQDRIRVVFQHPALDCPINLPMLRR